MNFLGNLLLYFVIGFVEMFMATQRTYWISKGKSSAAALLVFFESVVAMFIIMKIANELNGDIGMIVSYSAGNAVGTYINLEKVPF